MTQTKELVCESKGTAGSGKVGKWERRLSVKHVGVHSSAAILGVLEIGVFSEDPLGPRWWQGEHLPLQSKPCC